MGCKTHTPIGALWYWLTAASNVRSKESHYDLKAVILEDLEGRQTARDTFLLQPFAGDFLQAEFQRGPWEQEPAIV